MYICTVRRLANILKLMGRAVATLLLVVLLLAVASNVSPIYDFAEPTPFTGPDIYNPYEGLDTTHCWRRANFHTHTRVEGPLNECDYTAAETYDIYSELGYDILGFSNHNLITEHPIADSLQMNIYEHGYNVMNYHLLVFGSERVWHFDNMTPMLISQQQFQIEMLREDSDLIEINHPHRTSVLDRKAFSLLANYDIVELTSGRGIIENEHWDWALSAGHYCHGLLNDDLHFPDETSKIAVRTSFLCVPTAAYDDVVEVLRRGCFYSMRVPDYGDGDWQIKRLANMSLPEITDIGLRGDTVHIALSEVADSVKFVGQDHTILLVERNVDRAQYVMRDEDSYVRIMAFFDDESVIFSNAFARYDSSVGVTPFKEVSLSVDILLTILYNLVLVVVVCLVGRIIYLLWRRRKSVI